jgi:hypothetical protein
MIHRKLFIAAVIIASVVITACSDMTAPQKLVPGGSTAAAIVAPHPGPATVVATINGGGTAEMSAPGAFLGKTAFGMGVKLYSDGSATGHIDCVDQHGSTFPGNIWGEVTSWSMEGTVIVLNVSGVGLLKGSSFTVKIQQFGGAGVGHWTLHESDPPSFGFPAGFMFCNETLTSGQIVYRPE